MRFEILGPLRVSAGGEVIRVGGPRERKILAALLVSTPMPVPESRLSAVVWGAEPPATARAQIHNGIAVIRSSLKRAGRTACVVRSGSGFTIDLSGHEFDLAEFESRVAEGRRLADPERAVELLREALDRWRGPALDGLRDGVLWREALRLDERRLSCLEQRIGLDLRLGRHTELVSELAVLTAEYPAWERLLELRMLALYRSGRRREALDVFAEARRRLIDETGLDPSPSLARTHRAILRGDPLLDLEAAPGPAPSGPRSEATREDGTSWAPGPVPDRPIGSPAPAQLPPDVPDFVGRSFPLAELTQVLAGPRSSPITVTIVGSAGVGKTATAVHWGWQVRDRFPDGQLYLDLRGHAPTPPLRPIEALARLLDALGVPAEDIPLDIHDAAAAYRQHVAGRRILIVLDDASGAEQVQPLLPASPGSVTVVTSRTDLGPLAADDTVHPVDLDVMSHDEAFAMLSAVLGEDRVRAAPAAATDLAEICDRLPLALRIVAANLANRPGLEIADHAADLRGHDRLAALHVDGDVSTSVRAAFELSYRRLAPPERRLFRLLGLVPGPDFTVAAAAALADVPDASARQLLGSLARVHLVMPRSPGRYSFHDLLRLYAADTAEREDGADERTAARDRLLRHYLAGVDAAARSAYPEKLRLSPGDGQAHPPTDHGEAVHWLDIERANLVAAVVTAADRAHPAAWLLADAMRGYFFLRMHTVDWLAVARAGLAAAEATGDLRGQAACHLSLADVHRRRSLYRRAVEHQTRALALARDDGWLEGEAVCLGNLANIYSESGRLPEAAAHYLRALDIEERTGRLASRAVILGNLGLICYEMGQLDRSTGYLTQALVIGRQLGARYSEAVVLESLGEVYLGLGRPVRAVEHLQPALAIHRELGDRGAEAETLRILADVRCETGGYDEAVELAGTALTLSLETGERRVEANALNSLAAIRHRTGQRAEAITHYEQALRVARATANRYPEVVALIGLAAAEAGLCGRGRAHACEAVTVAADIGYRMLEGQARTALAGVHLIEQRLDECIRCARDALAIHRETGHRLGEARALELLGHALGQTEGPDAARSAWQRAYTIVSHAGAADTRRLQTLLQAPVPSTTG